MHFIVLFVLFNSKALPQSNYGHGTLHPDIRVCLGGTRVGPPVHTCHTLRLYQSKFVSLLTTVTGYTVSELKLIISHLHFSCSNLPILTEDKVIQGTYPHQVRVTMNHGFHNPSPKGEKDIFTFHRLFSKFCQALGEIQAMTLSLATRPTQAMLGVFLGVLPIQYNIYIYSKNHE